MGIIGKCVAVFWSDVCSIRICWAGCLIVEQIWDRRVLDDCASDWCSTLNIEASVVAHDMPSCILFEQDGRQSRMQQQCKMTPLSIQRSYATKVGYKKLLSLVTDSNRTKNIMSAVTWQGRFEFISKKAGRDKFYSRIECDVASLRQNYLVSLRLIMI